MPDNKMTSAEDAAVLERRRKLAEWYDQYEIMAEILLDAELSGTLKKGRDWMEGFRSEMVSGLAGGVAGKKALDIGCQYGVFSFRLAEDGAKVTGMDISEKWVNRCIKDARFKHPDKEFTFMVGDAQALPFEDGSFDVVVCTEVVEHVDFAGNVLSEIHRVLTPGGVLVLGTPNTRSYYVWLWSVLKGILPMDLVRSVLKKIVSRTVGDITNKLREQLPEDRREEFDRESARLKELGEELGLDDPGGEEFSEHIREFSNREMVRLLELMGFEVEKKTGFPVFPTYYFLGLRLRFRDYFVQVKDDSWWRFHSAPQMYLRAVKQGPALFRA